MIHSINCNEYNFIKDVKENQQKRPWKIGRIDEAFFRESFKGNHKKSTTFTIPRKAHKSGVKGS